MTTEIETLVIGGGQAGLAMSYLLTERGRPHLVIEQAARVAEVWRTQRWDSFALVTPNWQIRLPGAEYAESDPDGFMSRDEIATYIEQYSRRYAMPIRCGVRASSVEQIGARYLVHTTADTFEATNVVLATGTFQRPSIPRLSADLLPHVRQIHSSEYRSPSSLPPGAVLVVGSGQSGCQIAEELRSSGRDVYLSVGRGGRLPRRYRGRDTLWWLSAMGFYARTVDKLPSPAARFTGGVHVAGSHGGHTINLHQFARDGVKLLGHVSGVAGERILLKPDLRDSLAAADEYAANIVKVIDEHVARSGLSVPPEELPELRDGYDVDVREELSLSESGITAVVWATGYSFDFSLVKLPVLDAWGYPIQDRGVTRFPGLYFVGLHWLNTIKSGLLFGVGDDAAHLASIIEATARQGE